MIAPSRRRILLAAAFLAALVSAALAPSEEAAPPSAKRAGKLPAPAGAAPEARRTAASEIEVPPVSNYKRTSDETVEVIDIFDARPVPGSVPATPPKPVAPKPPFYFSGLVEEAGLTKAVLVQGNDLIIVAKGDQFGAYQVEEIDSAKLVVTFLPLGERQNVPLGETAK